MLFHPRTLGSVTDLGSDKTWSSTRLAEEIERRAALLRRVGVGPRSRVAIAHGGSPAFFADLLASWQLGACAVCLNPELAEPELANVRSFVEPALLLTEDGPDGGVRGVAVETGPAPGLDDPALILFTSGTTGDPKGVVHTFRSLHVRVALNRAWLGDAALARSLCVLPTHFGHGLIGNCLTPLLAGHDVFLASRLGWRLAAHLGDTLRAHDITFLSSVPSFWKLVLRMDSASGAASLLRVGIGSAPLSSALWQAVIDWTGTRCVTNLYGITETANWFSGASAADGAPEDGWIGTPFGGRFAVRDDAGGANPTGEGELLVQTPSLMSGYFQRDDLTREVVVDGWLRTGDLGRVDAAGAYLTGRIKHEICRAGIKIQPEEIDLLLERHEAVQEACAFGVPDPASGEVVAVAVRAEPGILTDPRELRTWCSRRIRREAVPERWFVLDEIPRNERGKLNRDRVRERCLEAKA